MSQGLVVDLFAGGGGASVGIEAALGRPIDIAINHDAIALAVHKANHPETRHLEADLYEVKPREATGGRPVDVLWASPDCTHHSTAKGGKPLQQDIRSLAWVVVRWAAAVKPRVIFVENVPEFLGWGPLDKKDRPIKRRKGATYLRWRRQLESFGYNVEHRILDASLFGAPTRRRRVFIVARLDGRPVRWPEPTHGEGRLPLRTAAECIDWSLPCPSIFERKRPLAEKTQWRVAQGIRKFVLENARPFIVTMAHGEVSPDGAVRRRGNGAADVDAPLGAVEAQSGGGGFGIVAPSLMKFRHDSHGAAVDQPMPVVTAGGQPRPKRPATGNPLGVLAPHLVKVNHGKDEPRGASLELPLHTVCAAQRGDALVTPILATIDQRGSGDGASTPADAPLPTTVTKNRHAVIAPTLVQMGYGERPGQAARVPGLQKPLGTVVVARKHALVGAWLAKHFGGVVGAELERPAATVTAKDHHGLAAVLLEPGQRHGRGQRDAREPLSTVVTKDRHAVSAATLVRFNHDDHGVAIDEPMPTITAASQHIAAVRAFLTAFYGSDGSKGKGQSLRDPMRTLSAKHRLGLVTIEGTEYQIVDIGLRMLQPHELLRAQFGEFAEGYDLSAARGKKGGRSKSAEVRLIGNSVCPHPARALVLENVPEGVERAA